MGRGIERDLRGIPAYELARTRTVTIPGYISGSALRFHALAEKGIPIRVTLADLVKANEPGISQERRLARLNTLLPHKILALDKVQGVSPENYDMTRVLVNSIVLSMPKSTMPMGVGISTDAIPPSYHKIAMKQAEDMAKQMGMPMRNKHVIAHIPAGSQDIRQIPLLAKGSNAIHGKEITSTFGGLTPDHFGTGIINLRKDQAIAMGFPPPPPEHEAKEAPPGYKQAYNSWAIVPHGHVLSQLIDMPTQDIKLRTYCVHQMSIKTNETTQLDAKGVPSQQPQGRPIPFVLMDTWTINNYAEETARGALDMMDYRNIAEVDVTIHPLVSEKWIDCCSTTQVDIVGEITFDVIVTFTAFPGSIWKNPRALPVLSEEFPRRSFAAVQAQQGRGGEQEEEEITHGDKKDIRMDVAEGDDVAAMDMGPDDADDGEIGKLPNIPAFAL